MITLFTACPALAEDTTNARYLCALLDKTGLTSAKCEMSVWNAAVITTIDMNSGEARDLCQQVAQHLAKAGRRFDREWTLQIRSPYSGENSIAFCDLPH